jgi:hypothetical protein
VAPIAPQEFMLGYDFLDWRGPALQNPRAETLAGWRTLGTRHHLFRQRLVAA